MKRVVMVVVVSSLALFLPGEHHSRVLFSSPGHVQERQHRPGHVERAGALHGRRGREGEREAKKERSGVVATRQGHVVCFSGSECALRA
jgi:hypothetical protein